MLRYLLLVPLTLVSSGHGLPARALPASASSARVDLAKAGGLERIAVIGASASAGFLLPTDLGEALEFLLACEHEPVVRAASSRFFLDPLSHAERQVVTALAADASVVVALDFLFWFSYGVVADEADRARLLERGLEFLESFDCPVLTSTVPDMRASTGRMLTARQVPRVETLDALNERIRDWAAGRPSVVLVSLPDWHAEFISDRVLEVYGRPWPPPPADQLLLWDQLHPNVDGLSLIACKVLEGLVEGCPSVERGAVRLDPSLVANPVHARLRSIVERR